MAGAGCKTLGSTPGVGCGSGGVGGGGGGVGLARARNQRRSAGRRRSALLSYSRRTNDQTREQTTSKKTHKIVQFKLGRDITDRKPPRQESIPYRQKPPDLNQETSSVATLSH